MEPDQAQGGGPPAPQPSYLSGLNPEQRAAVTHDYHQPLCIIAGAGT